MKKITADVPNWIATELDILAEDAELTRSEVIKDILEYVLNDEERIDEIFPPEEEE